MWSELYNRSFYRELKHAWHVAQQCRQAHYEAVRKLAQSIGWVSAARLHLFDLGRELDLRTNSIVRLKLKNCAHPVEMRTGNSSDRQVLHQVFVDQEYDRASPSNPKTILDLGAYAGYTSAYFLTKYPQARVVAVEPDPGNLALCRKNLKSFSKRVKVVHGAAWPESATLNVQKGSFRDGRDWATQVISAASGSEGGVQGYEMSTLIDFCGTAEVDLLKVDIEGSELGIFCGNTAAWLPRVRNLCIELHGPACERAFQNALADYRFDQFRVGELVFCHNLKTHVLQGARAS